MHDLPLSEQPSAVLAAQMHDLSVHLWNALWREADEDFAFPERDTIEAMQAALEPLAYLRGANVPGTPRNV
jgi:hypothetical protein